MLTLHQATRMLSCLTRISFSCLKKSSCTFTPQQRHVFLFPGQGSQYVGMAKMLASHEKVKKLFETASDVLGYDLLRKCLSGPKSELDKTIYCQPAVFVASLAALEWYKVIENGSLHESKDTVTAGFSVGEYAALVLSKSLTFKDALRLVDIRAKTMQKASDEVVSGMVTVTGLDEEGIQKLVKSAEEYCQAKEKGIQMTTLIIANYLYPKGFVLSGHRKAIDYVLKFGHEHGANKASELAVSGAFHTPLMKSAQTAVTEALAHTNVQTPQLKVYSNVTGKPYESSEDIKRLLPRQVVEAVKWNDIMKDICAAGSEQRIYELGPGRYLKAILAKTERRLLKNCKNIET